MAIYVIPTSTSNPHYTQSVQLSGVSYTMTLRYNTRMQRWVLNVGDAAGNDIVNGLVMLTGRSLNSHYTTLSVPPGVLFCFNGTDLSTQPTLASFLTDTSFAYYDPTA